MSELELQSTENLLLLLKAITMHRTTGLDFEKNNIVGEVIKIISERILSEKHDNHN